MNIATTKSRKVVGIQSLSKDELERLRVSNVEALKYYEHEREDVLDSVAEPYQIAIMGTILTIIAASHGDVPPNIMQYAYIFDGVFFALPTLKLLISGAIRKRKKKVEKEIEKEIQSEYDCRAFEKEKERETEALQSLRLAIEKITSNNRSKKLIAAEMKEYLGEGADEELLQLPGIQQIFELSLQTFYPRDHREFVPKKLVRNVQPDGSFTIATRMILPPHSLCDDDTKTYEVRYCKNGDEDHYVQVKYNNMTIYLDRDGIISSIETLVEYNGYSEIISTPVFKNRRNRNKLNAAMAALRQMEDSLSKEEVNVPSIDFEGIKKDQEGVRQEVAELFDTPIDEPKHEQLNGFQK